MCSIFWTNEKLSLMVAWASSVSISYFRVLSSLGHLVWFFDSGNLIVAAANSWCPLKKTDLHVSLSLLMKWLLATLPKVIFVKLSLTTRAG